MLECNVQGFWATDNLKLCEEFTIGHRDVLREHGYEHFKSNNTKWHGDVDTYVVLAKIGDKPVGGLRFVKKRKEFLVPLEEAILPLDAGIVDYMNSLINLSPFEICGLWNSRVVGGMKLSYFLSRLGLVMAPFFGWQASLCFMATYTFRIPRRLGYELVTSIGEEGYFNYPTPEFRAGVWIHNDIRNLGNCVSSEQERILSLRENLNQSFIEKNTKGGLLINYELKV